MCFFFQAEDGIRALTVTGVQTCALPICGATVAATDCTPGSPSTRRMASSYSSLRTWIDAGSGGRSGSIPGRSEERRVGKECRPRWGPYQQTNNTNTADPYGCDIRVREIQ